MGRKTLIILMVFTVTLSIYLASPIRQIDGDTRWNVPAAISFIRSGDFDLDEHREEMDRRDAWRTVQAGPDAHTYNYFPLAPSLFAVPVVWVFDHTIAAWSESSIPFYIRVKHFYKVRNYERPAAITAEVFYREIEMVTSALLCALAVVFFWLAVARFLPVHKSIPLALLFAFGTSIWSTASRGLWSHAPSLFLLCIALWIITGPRKYWAGLPLAVAYFVRPLDAIPAGVLWLYVLSQDRRQAVYMAALAMIPIAAFTTLNIHVYGALYPPYFGPGRIGIHAKFIEALYGNMISPNRGLLVFSPILLFSGLGAWLWMHTKEHRTLTVATAAIVILHWLAISCFPHWYGGACYGPRMFSGATPFAAFLLVPVFGLHFTKRRILAAAVTVLAVLSIGIHYRGANVAKTWHWNTDPCNICFEPERIWSISPPQIIGYSNTIE